MATTTAPKPAAKPSASAAASKGLTKGNTIVLPSAGENPDSPTASSKKVNIRKNARGTKASPKDAAKPTGQLVKAEVGTAKSTTSRAKRDEITPEESSRFVELGKLVRGGLKKMSKLSLEVAAALQEIRDQHLYRGKYTTFKAYCAAELGIQKAYAYDLAKAGAVHRDLQSAMADQSALPTNERQIRPLTKLTLPAHRLQAWAKARELAGDGKVTEAHVRKAVREIQPSKKKPTTGPASVPEPENAWHDQMVTKFTAEGFEPVSQQPITWPSDAVTMYSSTTRRYVKFIGSLDYANSACVVALEQKSIPCLTVISAAANSPQGIVFSKGAQPKIEKESFPPMFHVMARALEAMLEIDGTFYRAGDLDDSSTTTWAPASYLNLELPEPSEDSNADAADGQ